MDFSGFNLPDLTPRIDTSFIDEMNKRNQEIFDSITPLNEILAEEIKPILEGNQKVVEGLNDNYSKLNDLYLLKEKELEEAEKAKKYNTKMLIIALVSAGIALASLVATILIAVL